MYNLEYTHRYTAGFTFFLIVFRFLKFVLHPMSYKSKLMHLSQDIIMTKSQFNSNLVQISNQKKVLEFVSLEALSILS